MCKLMIKRVEKKHEPKSGEKNGKRWELWIFDCVVDVDSTGKEAVRTVKTFDRKTAELIGKTKPEKPVLLDAKKQGETAPFEYLVEGERRGGTKAQGYRGTGETNRQRALNLAVELARGRAAMCGGEVPADGEILKSANVFFEWLENGRGAAG
ncbi:MAG: hypothetical protein WC959_10675 [Kiritimatiellales bacterium]